MKYVYKMVFAISGLSDPKPPDTDAAWELHLFAVSVGGAYYVWRKPSNG